MDCKVLKRLISLSAFAVCLLCCESAMAQVVAFPVPLAPSFNESVSNSDGVVSSTAPFDVTNGAATAGTRYAAATGSVESVTINAGSSDGQNAAAGITWSFVVNAPPTLSPVVDVLLMGHGDLSISGPSNPATTNNVAFSMASPWGSGILQTLATQTFDNQANQFNIDFTAFLMAGQLYNVTEMLNAFSNPTDGSVTDLVTGSIDPLVGLTDQEIAEGYSVTVSPSPVPLPSSAWLMVAGLGGLGMLVRKRRTDHAVPQSACHSR
jgi:PEP-CTERM motif